MAAARPYDLVLFGATGFTGRLTAEYLARAAPEGCRWALAGRDADRLAAVRAGLAAIDPRCAELPLLVADAGDREALRKVAASARVVVSTVGPYLRHGEPLVAACADSGTDYVDLTGEPEFVDRMYLRHHERAVATGARLVHACGFDSVPHDLGVLFTVEELLRRGATPERISVEGFVRVAGTVSGGTLASAMTAFSRPRAMARAARERRAAEPRPRGRRVRTPAGRPHRSRAARAWALPLPTIDPQVVGRSAAALDAYGPDFGYTHYAAVRRLPIAVGGVVAVTAIALAAQLRPLRRALERLRKPGEGPGARQRAGSWFTVRFVARTDLGRPLVTEVSGGDPGYQETAVMLAESALCLAYDDLPTTAGQLTTAVAMGRPLIDRLASAGLSFRVLDAPPTGAPGH
ncbi:saccharopine dehydrogenase [Streptomyces sp. XY431]|uniref:saccharopine dehydrogenase family protein n=1 Tax=Streptomyces sp. XY431 TaxID=1415562 RepID=UPI0006AF6D60|nr:saccharopine dehydrogenase NADP-binding domain-containing protein [Streptomyces sp. XY431]KOV11077.1 saccharopine dehydrogenase [Streptomyces sp. XY431]